MQIKRHQRVALLLNLADKAAYLGAVHQQLFGAGCIRCDVGGCGFERVNLAANKKQLAIAHYHIAVSQLDLAFACGFDFPAVQHHACFVLFFKKIVESGFFVIGNAVGTGFFLGGHIKMK